MRPTRVIIDLNQLEKQYKRNKISDKRKNFNNGSSES